MKQAQAKHKLCRRLGYCIWNMPKCPSVKRPYAAGLQGKNAKKKKLTTYGVMMQEKQKLKAHYCLTEKQMRNVVMLAKSREGKTNEIMMQHIEMRLDAAVYHAGFAPTIFAARQYVAHRHILVNGKIVDRPSYELRAGQVISINAGKSPKIAETVKAINTATPPPYFEVNKDDLKITVLRLPLLEEIPITNIETMRVVEFYAR